LKYSISVKLVYNFNYKPYFKSYRRLRTRRIFYKNLFFLLFFIEYFLLKKKMNINYYIFFNKKAKMLNSITRSPNRNKKSQIKLFKEYYEVSLFCKFNNFFFLSDNIYFILFFNDYMKSINFFESSIVFLKKKTVRFNVLGYNKYLLNFLEL
jgi:hypothetical protein